MSAGVIAAGRTKPATSYAQEVLADTPLAYWRLGEASGSAMVDASGSARDGTYVGGPTLGAAGAVTDGDTAVSFDGIDDHANVPHGAWMNVADLTVEAWIKTTATGTALILDRDGADTGDRVFQFRVDNGKLQFIRIADANGVIATASATSVASVNDGAWHQVAATYSDNSTIRLYIDGAADSVVTDALGGLRQATTRHMLLGINGNGSQVTWFPGVIDEVAVYGTALSAERIAAHYAAA